MQEKWLKDIRDRMAGFETDVPDGLWEDICEKLAETAPEAVSETVAGTVAESVSEPASESAAEPALRRAAEPRRGPSVVLLYMRRIASVAAVAAVILAARHFFRDASPSGDAVHIPATAFVRDIGSPLRPDGDTVSGDAESRAAEIAALSAPTELQTGSRMEKPVAANDGAAAETRHEKNRPEEHAAVSGRGALRGGSEKESAFAETVAAHDEAQRALAADSENTGGKAGASENAVPDTDASETGTGVGDGNADEKRRRSGRAGRYGRTRENVALAAEASVSRGRHPVSLGAFTSGGSDFSFSGRSGGGYPSAGMEFDGAEWKGSPLLGILLHNKGRDVVTDIRHRQPVRAGVTVAFGVNRRLAAESGITYSRLSSDMRDGTDTHYYDGEQILHYVGIPLNLKYDIASWGGFAIYGSAGVLAEKCVAGKLKREYVLDGFAYPETAEKVSEKPFQLSANLSAGLRYDFGRVVSLYAEPGISYYFDDGSSLETIYKERPLNFNINIGIRFTVGR